MILLWISIAIVFGMFVGVLIGLTLRNLKYDGVITIEETEKGLTYTLTVSDDPELLANQPEARFKIIPPSYEASHSRE